MNLKFWQKKIDSAPDQPHQMKLSKPKEIPQRVGIHLIAQLKEDPDWVWDLRIVSRPRTTDKHTADVRIFDPREAASAGVVVKDYNSLENHPELILFSGSFNKTSGAVNIQKTLTAAA